jgi:hypothetical protein
MLQGVRGYPLGMSLRAFAVVSVCLGLCACGPGPERLAAEFPAHKSRLVSIRDQLSAAFASEPSGSMVIVGSEYGPRFHLEGEKSELVGAEARAEIERRGLTPVLRAVDEMGMSSAGIDRRDGLEVWISTSGSLAYLWRENGKPPTGYTGPIQAIRDEPSWFVAHY